MPRSVWSDDSSSTMDSRSRSHSQSHSARDDDEYTNDGQYTTNDEYTNDECTNDGEYTNDEEDTFITADEDTTNAHMSEADIAADYYEEDHSIDESTDDDDDDDDEEGDDDEEEDYSVSAKEPVRTETQTVGNRDNESGDGDDEEEDEEQDNHSEEEERYVGSVASGATELWGTRNSSARQLTRSNTNSSARQLTRSNTNSSARQLTRSNTNSSARQLTRSNTNSSARQLTRSNTNSSTTSSSQHQQPPKSAGIPRILANHQRIPGGAAAKLIGVAKPADEEDEDYQFINDGDDALEVAAPLDELIQSRERARAEFSTGPSDNKRYHAVAAVSVDSPRDAHNNSSNNNSNSNDDRTSSTPSTPRTPRILDRAEAFHENAAAAIVSILTPVKPNSNAPGVDAILTARSSDLERTPSMTSMSVMSTGTTQHRRNPAEAVEGPFSRPARTSNIKLNIKLKPSSTSTSKSTTTIVENKSSRHSRTGNDAVDDAIETLVKTGASPLVQSLVTEKTVRHLANLEKRMKDPTRNLTELMEAIATPTNCLFDRHYMVRRKNACGALKVLAANAAHRVNICWTVGVLPALTSVLEDCGQKDLEDAFPSATIREEYTEARKRAVSTLVYLAMPKDNKLPMFHCPRLVAALVRTIEQDQGEARRGCCAVLAHLGKSKENRLIMSQIPGLLDAVASVIEPKEAPVEPKRLRSRYDDYDSRYGEGEGDDDDSYTDHDDDDDDDVTETTSHHRRSAFSRDDEVERSLSEKSPEQVLSEDDPAESSARYDEDPDPFLHAARQNVFACLGHLLKEKDNAYVLARHAYLVTTLISITMLQESSSQHFALKLLAQLSRHLDNSNVLVFKMKNLVPAVVFATHSEDPESRKHACFALQNFSQDKPCRQQLASVDNLLPAICRRIRSPKHPEERLAALHTLKNLTDEPANLIPMTNTPECFATLMQVAHAGDDSITELMQYLGCDALATLSHWFRSIATSGQRIGTKDKSGSGGLTKDEMFVPTLRVLTWEPWQ